MISQLKKGILELCILYAISKKELYGYELMKFITSTFVETNESTVYAILRRLLSEKYTESFIVENKDSTRPPRKYYKITPKGSEYLQDNLLEWYKISDAVNDIINHFIQ